MSGALVGKVAIVTGGSSGIGLACVERFAQEGADVVIGDIAQRDDALRVAKEAGGRAIFRHTDTTREEDCDGLVRAAVDEFGRVDIGVASAGIARVGGKSNVQARAANPEAGHVVNLSTGDFQAVLEVNVLGVMMTCRALARQMLAQGDGGSIIPIASTAATIPLAGAAPYCVSKAGVAMLTKVMATELATAGVRVNAVGPGYTSTAMTAGMEGNPAAMALAMGITPMGRLGTPEEIANAVIFLASPESSFFTGQLLYPAGGQFTG